MIYGETVKVSLCEYDAQDEYGNEQRIYAEPIEVEGVLVGRGDTVNIIDDGQPYAIKADRRFCFPRWWTEDLRGALIERMGTTYQVVGNPAPITDANIPAGIRWNIKAEAVVFNG